MRDLIGRTLGHYRVVDVETGRQIPVQGNAISLVVKKHDVREFRIVP